jgi:hypothetical protein
MCLVCNCFYCKNGGCDGHHFAHDMVRKLRAGEVSRATAIIIVKSHESMSADEAAAYLDAHKDDWGEVLPDIKDDQGGTI